MTLDREPPLNGKRHAQSSFTAVNGDVDIVE
jgi:hypothetical protein